jgi:GTP cyclohydrolase I
MVINHCWNADTAIGIIIGPEIAKIMKIWVNIVSLRTSIQEILTTKIELCITLVSLNL